MATPQQTLNTPDPYVDPAVQFIEKGAVPLLFPFFCAKVQSFLCSGAVKVSR